MKTISKLLFLGLMTSVVFPAWSYTSTYVCTLYRHIVQPGGEIEEPEEPVHRIPSRPVEIIIGEDGVELQGALAEDEILSYEVWSFDGWMLLSTTEEKEFIDILFSQTEPVDIKLITSSAEWTGTVMM